MKRILNALFSTLTVAVVAIALGSGVAWVVNHSGGSTIADLAEMQAPNQSPRPFVVRVVVEFPRYNDVGTGSLIQGDLVQTANHVIRDLKNNGTLYVELPDGKVVTGKVIKKDVLQDLALIQIDQTKFETVKLAEKTPGLGETVTVAGFAHGNTYTENSGKVTKFVLPGRKAKVESVFKIDRPAIGGMSGGPAFDASGNLVGVLWGSVDGDAYVTGVTQLHEFLKGTPYNPQLFTEVE